MDLKCKHCSFGVCVKNGVYDGKQRYKCKGCKRVFKIGDARIKYTHEKRVRVVKWYLEGCGVRSIERMEGISAPLILQWIKKFAKILRSKIYQDTQKNEVMNVRIMEIDELYSYCKKNGRKYISGLL
ncbi:IS1 family transposase domain protein [Candidatus Cyrtobacter comes]|uniref:IS1 family transposase domain protein n=1 Tax=Candidatus Cyrtobacter comes TaxID=675776 RepID=A0ABU5L9K9_9RICK|nr:hypothetical protein [Candidatus Cyrtobacter comes]MDZ5762808.1 IS1 family transposase domain protein [Candidatus Cyrtobacter comes]